MPDVFESYFNDFGKQVSDYYKLDKLNPAYEVYFNKLDSVKIGDSLEKICKVFDRVEPGSGSVLKTFMEKAEKHYEIAVKDMVYKPGISPRISKQKNYCKIKVLFDQYKKRSRKVF